MKTFKPFSNQDDAFTIGGFTIENANDKVSLYGSLDLTRNDTGLKQAKALQSILDAVVRALEQDASPPDQPKPPAKSKPVKKVKNPFA